MRWVIAGASGFLGTALRTALIRDGHLVTRLVRRDPRSVDESAWDPVAGKVDSELLARADVVVNLAGVSVARIPWTRSYQRLIRDSRVQTTGTLANALSSLSSPAARPSRSGLGNRPVLVVQSASGYYGKDRGEVLDESATPGDDVLANVVRDWEAAAEPAEAAGVRVVRLRAGLVLDRTGGAFPLMSLPFRFGLGGRLGSGRQVMPVVSLPDWLAAVRFVADNGDCDGPYNVVVPQSPTNAEYTAALGSALHRPTLFRVPAAVLRAVLGGFAGELLGSADIRPRRLLEAGFEFAAPDITALMRAALRR